MGVKGKDGTIYTLDSTPEYCYECPKKPVG